VPVPISLSFDMVLVIGILIFTVGLSLSNVIRVDVVAVLVLVVIGITRLLPANQLFSGFSSEAVISLIAIMIIGAGLEKAGIALKAARWILKIGRERPRKISIVLMLTSGFLSAFTRSLGAVAVLLPVVTRITGRTGIPKSRLLIPMGFCSIIGGSLTMVGSSPLILLNSLLNNANDFIHQEIPAIQPFHLFSVFPIGFVLLIIGIAYFHFFGKRLLPQEPLTTFNSGTTKTHFLKTYGKGGDIFELKVPVNSPLVNVNLKGFELKLDASSSVLAVIRGKELHFPPLRKMIIEPNAIIAIMGIKERVVDFAEHYGLKLYPRLNSYAELLHPVRSGLAEAVIPPSSQLIGLELRELHMRRTYQLHVLALFRGQTVSQGEELKELVLRSGDTLGIFCQWEALADFHKNPDFVVLTTSYPREEIRPKKMWFALLFFFLALILIVVGKFPVSVGLLLGAVGMIATGVLTIDEAYDTVSWSSVFLLAGLIPLGLAIQTTHTSDWVTQHIPFLHENLPVWVIESVLALLSTFFSFAISPVGATIVLVPIALDLATSLGAEPRVFALIVALCASNSFLLPMQQVNALISGPGSYKSSDFFRAGIGLTLLYWVIVLVAVNFLFK
jgi:di/tricarboxylate transporter